MGIHLLTLFYTILYNTYAQYATVSSLSWIPKTFPTEMFLYDYNKSVLCIRISCSVNELITIQILQTVMFDKCNFDNNVNKDFFTFLTLDCK